jgi:hypothetical protein
MTRSLVLDLALAFALGACGVRPCRSGTVFLTINLSGSAASADSVEVDALSGADHLTGRFGFNVVGSGTVEIIFPSGYQAGQQVSLRVTAYRGAARLTAAQVTSSLVAGCSALSIDVGASDGGACEPRETRCSEDRKTLLTCRMDGSGHDEQPCGLGCNTTATPARCLRLQPSGSLEPDDYALATAMVTFSGGVVLNTESGEITGGFTRPIGEGDKMGVTFRSVAQPGSTVRVGAFGFAKLDIPAGASISFTGRNPVALLSAGDITLAGTIDARGDCVNTVGPGAQAGGRFDVNNGDGLGVRGGKSGATGVNAASGGGGGGYGHAGGNGGSGAGVAGGAGGQPFGDLTSELLVLIGGSGGGAGGGGMLGGAGGSGGGAVQIASNANISISGTLLAGGCGGRGAGAGGGGGGGGAGGAILIEGAKLDIASTAILAANGGGGGGGANNAGQPGGHGGANATRASAGAAGGSGTAGGAGGARGNTGGAQGVNVSGSLAYGGGGGGACGRIALKTQDGAYTDAGALLSPGRTDLNAQMQPLATAGRASFE